MNSSQERFSDRFASKADESEEGKDFVKEGLDKNMEDAEEMLSWFFDEPDGYDNNALWTTPSENIWKSILWVEAEMSKSNEEFLFGKMTPLQTVCVRAQAKSTKRLIESGDDIHSAPVNPRKPIQLACIYARKNVLQVLLDKNGHLEYGKPIKDDQNRNLIHLTVLNNPNLFWLISFFKTSIHALRCLKILLDPKYGFDINEGDAYNRTPLHYAVMQNKSDFVVELLKQGASLCKTDNSNQMPLTIISNSDLKKFLLHKIQNDKSLIDYTEFESLKSKYDKKDNVRTYVSHFIAKALRYLTFRTEKNKERRREALTMTDFIHEIRGDSPKNELPVTQMYIHFKWLHIRKLFYFNLFFHFLYACFYTYSVTNTHTNTGLTVKFNDNTLTFFIALTHLFLVTIISAELAKILRKRFFQYFFDILNLLRITNIILTVLFLNGRFTNTRFEMMIATVSLTWLDLAIMAGKHPNLAHYKEALFKSIFRMILALIFYSTLSIGFVLSFHVWNGFTSSSDTKFSDVIDTLCKMVQIFIAPHELGAYPGDFNRVILISFHIVSITAIMNAILEFWRKANLLSKNAPLYKTLGEIDVIKYYESNCCKSNGKYFDHINKTYEGK